MDIVSDLHLEFGKGIPWFRCETLLVAGDATTYPYRENHLRKIRETCDRMVYVLGNHEYYQAPPDVDVVREYSHTCTDLDITILEDGCARVGDWIVWGSTFWSTCEELAALSDCRFVTAEYVQQKHAVSKVRLEEFLGNYTIDDPLLVMTHHMPSRSLIAPKYRGSFESCFASESDHLIRRPISVWVYGHTHTANQSILNNVRMICNPRGYPGENRRAYVPFTLQ